MLTFKKAELSDIDPLRRALSIYDQRVCDYSPGNIVFWRNYYGISRCFDEDGLILKYESMGDDVCYSYPISNDPEGLIKKLLRDCGSPVCLSCLTRTQLDAVKQRFEVINTIHSEDFDDYLYNAEDIVTLAGRRYSGQRNHINRFKNSYSDWCFEVISEDNAFEAKEFCHRYFNGVGKVTEVSEVEYIGLCEQFDNFGAYGQLGGMLKVNGTVIGISVGEIVGDPMGFVSLIPSPLVGGHTPCRNSSPKSTSLPSAS